MYSTTSENRCFPIRPSYWNSTRSCLNKLLKRRTRLGINYRTRLCWN